MKKFLTLILLFVSIVFIQKTFPDPEYEYTIFLKNLTSEKMSVHLYDYVLHHLSEKLKPHETKKIRWGGDGKTPFCIERIEVGPSVSFFTELVLTPETVQRGYYPCKKGASITFEISRDEDGKLEVVSKATTFR